MSPTSRCALRGLTAPGRTLSPATRLLAVALLCAALAPGCARRQPASVAAAPPGATREAAARRARSQALIEAGNSAYRAGDFAGAARRYAAATVVDPGDPAAQFGLGMALAKLGRDEGARAAYARARDLAQQGRAARVPAVDAGR